MALQGFTIDYCNQLLPGAGVFEYVPIDEVDASAYEEAIRESTWNHQTGISVADWYKLPFEPGSGRFSEDQDSPQQGPYYRISASATIASDTEAVRAEIQRMMRRKFLLRLTSGSQVLLLGSIERPLDFNSKFDSGNDGGDTRAHILTFTGVSLIKSPGFVPVF